MGWSNYVIIPKLKLAIEISRYADRENLYEEELEELLKEVDNFNFEILDKKPQELTLNDLSSLVSLARKSIILEEICIDYFLLWWLELRGVKHEVISEFEFDKRAKEEFKEYEVLEK